MDKTNHITTFGRYREGFALMITLSVLSVVIALTVVLLSYFTKVKKDSDTTKALIQADVYYADILSQLNKFKDKKAIFSRLYTAPLFLYTPDKRFTLMLRCSPLSAGVNMNWLALAHIQGKQAQFQEAQILYDTLVQQYNVEDPDRLLEMILQEIGLGKKFVTKEQSRLMQKNGIISYQQFSEIIKWYQMEVDDPKVTRIPWHKYFSFSAHADKIDIAYSSAELISYLFDIDLRSVREWMAMQEERPSLQVFVNQNGGTYSEKQNILASSFLGESHCSVNYNAGYKFTFDYIKGEAKYFEFFGKH